MLVKVNLKKYKYAYFIDSYNDSIDDVLDHIEDIFLNDEIDVSEKGYIVIDALLIRGNAYNRFYELPIANSNIDFSALSVIDIPEKHEIRELSSEYYKSKIEFLNTPLLHESTKFLISQGYTL